MNNYFKCQCFINWSQREDSSSELPLNLILGQISQWLCPIPFLVAGEGGMGRFKGTLSIIKYSLPSFCTTNHATFQIHKLLEFWFQNNQTKATPDYKKCTQQLHITSLAKLAVITVKSFLTDKHQGRFLVFNSSPSSCRREILFLLVWSWTWNKVEIKKRIEVRNIIDKYMYQLCLTSC